MEANKPEVVAVVRELFERHERVLIDKNVDVLDATFWNSPHTIRLSFDEHGYGFGEIHSYHVRRPPGLGTKEERHRLDILTLGDDFATVNLVFEMRGEDRIGRQSLQFYLLLQFDFSLETKVYLLTFQKQCSQNSKYLYQNYNHNLI